MDTKITVQTGKQIGQAIALARRARDMNVSALSEVTGLSIAYIEKIESGRTTSLLERELQILQSLGAQITIELPARDDNDDHDDHAPQAD